MQDDIDPEADMRLAKATGWLGDWESRPSVCCPDCEVSGYVAAKKPGIFGGNKWKCFNCESEDEGTLDNIDGKATVRLQQAQYNLWSHKEHVVCQHCQIRGFVVFKTTSWGGRKLRKCCNCGIEEELG
jgi:hypothetical protein